MQIHLDGLVVHPPRLKTRPLEEVLEQRVNATGQQVHAPCHRFDGIAIIAVEVIQEQVRVAAQRAERTAQIVRDN